MIALRSSGQSMLRSMDRVRRSHRWWWAMAPMIGALLLGAMACLHGEALRDPSLGAVAEGDIDAEQVTSAESTDTSVAVLGDPPSQVLAVAERSAQGEEDAPPVIAARRRRVSDDDAVEPEMKARATGGKKGKRRKKGKKEKKDGQAGELSTGSRAVGVRSEDGAGAGAKPAPVREIPGPPISMATVLGSTRRDLEARLVAEGVDGDDGWVHYGAGLTIRYEGKRAVEVALRVPAGLGCAEVARWAGFRRAMPPLYRVGGCTWPGLSARHRLHRGVIGELARTTGILQIWSTKKGSR